MPVVQYVDNAIHWINFYHVGNVNYSSTGQKLIRWIALSNV